MKILFIGDIHLSINRFDLSKQFLQWITDTIYECKPDLVVNLGDSFHSHAVLRSELMSEFMAHVYKVVENYKYVYLVGNHDCYKPSDSKYHALGHLSGKVKDFYVVDSTQDLFDITFVPYQHSPDTFPKQTKDICVAHQTFKGADYGNITTQEGVDFDDVSAQIIISGHIHKKQVLGKVVYPGSPFSQSVNDINQIKSVMLFDTATYKTTDIVCPLPMWKGCRHDITQTYSCDDLHKDLKDTLTATDHWVVELTGPKAEIMGYLESKQSKALFKDIDIKVKTIFTDKEKRLVSIKAFSIESIIPEYIDKVYSGSLDKDVLKHKSIELLNNINS